MKKMLLHVLILICCAGIVHAQPCTDAGHTPSSPILLCGADSYVQASVPFCGQTVLPVPCNGSFTNMNPTWFKMTCFNSGTLGFIITPDNTADNYDWQLFDISGRNNDDVFTDPSMFLACNWSPETGETGTDGNGNSVTVCSDAGGELFSKMPDLIRGHEYLLLVSQRNNSASGFRITITGGSASVVDPVEPALFNAKLSCDGKQLSVLLNKKMYCSTIAADGSDFSINAGTSIVFANAVDCSSEPETNYIILTLSNSLPPASYTLSLKNGNDGNTIRDKCGRYIPEGNSVPVILASTNPALPDSIRVVDCAPDVLRITFRKPVQCNSIASDGSDFIISGPQAVSVNNVTFTCNTSNASSVSVSEIDLHLSSSIITGGDYRVILTTGTDGNPVVDECGTYLLPGSFIPFVTKSSVSASFTHRITTSCQEDTVRFFHTTQAGVTSWRWSFNDTSLSGIANPVRIFPSSGEQVIQLIVTNGTCSDTARDTILLNNKVTAAFDMPDIICPEDTLHFVNRSSENTTKWEWSFGGGMSSNLLSPSPFNYPFTGRETYYTVQLKVVNTSTNCRDSVSKKVKVLSGCYIALPTAFTPNGDGLNDFLHPANALKAENLEFKVFNRFGQLVFATRDWTKKWDGRINGIPQATGVYVWMLNFTNKDTKEKIFMKGTTVLIR